MGRFEDRVESIGKMRLHKRRLSPGELADLNAQLSEEYAWLHANTTGLETTAQLVEWFLAQIS
jgi:hypothetical protein